MTIDKTTITRLKPLIMENIKLATTLYKERLYDEFASKNIFLQKEIILNSIAYAKIKEESNNIQNIVDTYKMEPDNEIYLAEDIPNSLIEELYNYIEVVIEKHKELFSVNPSQTGRYDLLFKGVLHCIKLIQINQEKKRINIPIEGISFNVELHKIIDLQIDKIIDISITFCKCYEADSRNNQMCLEVLHKNFSDYYKYQYKLDATTHKRLKKDIETPIQGISAIFKE